MCSENRLHIYVFTVLLCVFEDFTLIVYVVSMVGSSKLHCIMEYACVNWMWQLSLNFVSEDYFAQWLLATNLDIMMITGFKRNML